jgi:hypothetical protein
LTFVVDAYVETDLYNCNINVVVAYSNSGTNDDALLIVKVILYLLVEKKKRVQSDLGD